MTLPLHQSRSARSRKSAAKAAAGERAARSRWFRPALQRLEDRTVPSTFEMRITTASGFNLTIADGDANDANANPGVISYIGPAGNFALNIDVGDSKPASGSAASPDMALSFNATKFAGSAADAVTVEISDQGFTTSPLAMTAQVGGTLSGSVSQVTSQAFFDNGNASFGTGGGSSALETFTTGSFNATDPLAVGGATPYSLTERVVVSGGVGGGISTGSFELSSPPPSDQITTMQTPATAAVNSPISDTATVSGLVSPTGTVTFALYDNSTAGGTPLYTSPAEPLTATGTPGVYTADSPPTTVGSAGTVYWVASFSGDGSDNPVTSGAADEPVQITQPQIDIVKLTNGTNNDSPPVAGVPDGPTVPVGSTVTWTYNVTNPGDEPIANVNVTDNIAGVNPTPVVSGGFNVGDTNHDGLLEPGETWVFTASGTATAGQYSNVGTVTGTSTITNTPVTATNPDHYYGTLSLGDFVWNDVNANGIQDSNDLTSNGINGVLVDLKNGGGTVIATTTTGNNPVGGAPGYYQFSGLLQGSYTVVIDSSNFNAGGPLAGDTPTPSMVAGSTTANDSNGSPASVTLTNANDETIDFGYFQAAINIVKLTNGTNNDSPPVAGVPDGPTVPVGSTVTWTYDVTNPTGVALSGVSVTDNIAGVNPTPVLSGGFNVGDTNHDGLLENGETWVFTASGTATAGQYSNIGTATGTPVTPTGGTIPGATPVVATNPDHYYGTLSLGDFVWNDVNANGIQDSNDLTSNGINGVLVDLKNSGGTVIATTTTGNNPVGGAPGYYQFSGLLQGSYTVVIDSSNFNAGGPLAGDTPTPSMVAGSTPANDSNGSPAPVTLTTANDETIDFGYFQAAINIVKLTNGTNNDSPPVAGVPDGPTVPVGSTVTWTYDVTNPTGVALSGVSVTDNIAGVNPTPVLSGGFNVGDTNHDGLLENGETWVFTASGTATAGQYSNIGTATGTPVTPTGGTIPGATPVVATNPDHYYGTLSLGDFVWNDVNANGIQDSNDLTSNGINGVLVDLKNSGGTVIATTTTGNNPVGGAPGYYQFSGLLQGSYTVVIDSSNFASGGALFGFTPTPSMVAGSTPANDSNGSPAPVTLTTANDETIDFGYFQAAINIVKLTNGTNNDSPPVAGVPDGPTVPVGSTVTWTYDVTNPTGVALSGVSVTDNIAGVNPTPVLSSGFNVGDTNHDGLLENGETWVFTASGVAIAGQYSNIGTATGTPVTPTGGTIPGATPVTATNPDHYYGTLSLGDFVWNDVNANGIQDSNDLTSNGINGVLVDLKNGGGTVIATTTTGNNPVGGVPGYYQFSGLLQGSYTVVIDSSNFASGGALFGFTPTPSMVAGSTPANDSNGSPAPVTLTTANDETIDFGYVKMPTIGITTTPGGPVAIGTPNLVMTKAANVTAVQPFQPVTYTYTVTNTGNAPATNVSVVDDNGTPGFTADDFHPTPVTTTFNSQTYNVGDANHNGLLDSGETWKYTATVIPPVMESEVINGTDVPVGTLSVTQPTTGKYAGDYMVTFNQSLGIVDNTYGTNASSGWGTQGHSFNDLLGSDQADFQFTDSKGNVVLDFLADYISQGSSLTLGGTTVSYPSGYGTLGLGGDGKLNSGSASNILAIDTTITDNLNQSPAYYGFTTNSPSPSSPLDANWNNVDGYTVVISPSAFGSNGFGSVSIPFVHDSPSKISGTIKFTPVAQPSTVTNTATVTATANGTSNEVTGSATANVQIVPGGPTVQNTASIGLPTTFAPPAAPLTDSATLSGGMNPQGSITFYLFAPGVTPNATNSNNVYTTTVTVNGDGTYSTPATGYSPTTTGTYEWVAVYSGDTNGNPSVTSPFGSEPEAVSPPIFIATTPGGTVNVATPSLIITKTASATAVLPFQPVTYTYSVSNTGTAAASNVSVVDDNGTSGYTADDFNPTPVVSGGFNVGDTNHNGLLDPGETWKYTATVIPPVLESEVINGTDVIVGTLSVQQPTSGPNAGNYVVTFLQSLGIVDNTYGTNASSGWGTQGHKFNDLLGSDQADFQFTDSKGNVVLDFLADYISQGSSLTLGGKTVNYPSGYGTLGLGGDGKLNSGSAGNILAIDTTITDDLNQSPAYYGFITNSPTPNTALDANWNNVDGYTVVVSPATFGSNGFGSVTIPFVHDSPSKVSGTIKFTPVAEPSTVTNNVTVTATNAGTSTHVSANTGVSVQIVPGGPTNSTPVTASSSSAAMPTQLTDMATISGGNNPTGTVTFYLYAPGVTPGANNSGYIFTTQATVNGAGTYSTPAGFTPTKTGTYEWVAVYSGDSNNPGVTSPFGSEPETVGPPVAISTTPGGTVSIVNGVANGPLTDSATITGGYMPGGSVTFYLYAPGVTPDMTNDNFIYTNTVPVAGDGTYTTAQGNNPGGFTPTTSQFGLGTYEWVAVYGDDLNNAGVSSPFDDEPEMVSGGTPHLSVAKTADTSNVTAGQTAGYTVTISNTGTASASGVTLTDPLPAGNGGDVFWTIDSSNTGLGAGTTPADFTITGSQGSQSLILSSFFLTTLGDSLAPGQTISVHYTSPTNTADASGGSAAAFDPSGTAGAGVITLGTASNYSVLGLANVTINNSLVTITGNEGVSQGGKLTNQGPSTITGNVYQYASGQYSGPGTLGGSVITNPALLAQNDTDALNASATAAGLTATQTFGNITAATTVTGNGGLNVIDINGNINLNNASLTLSGTAADVFIVNVTGNATFGGTGGLMLSGGVTTNHVLYNFTGSVGGPAGTITSHVGNVFYGTLLAPKEGFNLDGAFVGAIIGGGGTGGIQLLSGATVNAGAGTLLKNTATVAATGLTPPPATATITVQPPPPVSLGDFAQPTFWGSPKGQALFGNLGAGTSTSLSSWLVSNFPNLYGSAAGPHNLVGVTLSQFAQPGPAGVLGKFGGPDQAVLAAAISVYATSQNLSGINLHSFDSNFNSSAVGSGQDVYNIGPNGAAFGLANNTATTVLSLLLDLNANTKAGAPLAPGAGPVFTAIDNTGNVMNAVLSDSGLAYSPAQVRTAYGVSGLTLDGTGQTIAIVDAYDNPAIFQSVDAFDTQFGASGSPTSLYTAYGPAATFLTVVNQDGSPLALPATDPSGAGTNNWEGEEALDVEWVHAMAPGAQIVLVEANSPTLPDLMTGVATAASMPGVSVVSMSWGFQEGLAATAEDEALYDSYLTTPAGHQGVTFVASTGDFGTNDPEYPAFSPNVLAVGGTSLYLNTDNSYASETGWGYNTDGGSGMFIGSGGGVSQFEAEPAFQQGVQASGNRTTPDVSFLADPATGAWISDSYNLGSDNPWEIAGGTSLSAPSWAALVALANQSRVANSGSTLGSTASTSAQQAVYNLPAGAFTDVTTGTNGGFNAGSGYDVVTGLGSPVANVLVPALANYAGAVNTPATPPTYLAGYVPSAPTGSTGSSGGQANFSVFSLETVSPLAASSARSARPAMTDQPMPLTSAFHASANLSAALDRSATVDIRLTPPAINVGSGSDGWAAQETAHAVWVGPADTAASRVGPAAIQAVDWNVPTGGSGESGAATPSIDDPMAAWWQYGFATDDADAVLAGDDAE